MTWLRAQLRRWRCLISPWHRAAVRQYPNSWMVRGPIVYCACGNVYRGLTP